MTYLKLCLILTLEFYTSFPLHFKSHILFSEMPQETMYTLMHTQHLQFPKFFVKARVDNTD